MSILVIQAEEVSEKKWASVNEIKELFSLGLFMLNDINEIDMGR
jgi:hypothetical protein